MSLDVESDIAEGPHFSEEFRVGAHKLIVLVEVEAVPDTQQLFLHN